MTFYCTWVTILNVLEWEWIFDKINILTILRNKNNQNELKQALASLHGTTKMKKRRKKEHGITKMKKEKEKKKTTQSKHKKTNTKQKRISFKLWH